MTKSTITREQLLEIIETDHVQCGEASYLASMALAAMDSESECLPLDYLQGHKDGLEWAAQLAEANHPETGDWLYDDPIELAKDIRKGPDMPPAQPAADSEPDRNPVLAYADSYRDMAKQGVESVPIWSVITDIERNIAPLYRHAQPAPVVPDERDKTVDADDHPLLWSFNEGWNACRAAMLQDQSGDDGEPTDDERIMAIEGIHNCERCGDEGWIVGEMGITRCACNQGNPVFKIDLNSDFIKHVKAVSEKVRAGNSPVIPDGYVMVPVEPNGDMLAAAQDAYGETDGDIASTLRAAMLAAAPQEVKP